MITNSSSHKSEPGKEQTLPDGIQESIYPNRHEINITDGGEFLDDNIRMKDQPYEKTGIEESE